ACSGSDSSKHSCSVHVERDRIRERWENSWHKFWKGRKGDVIAAREKCLVAERNAMGARRNAHAPLGLYSFLAFLVICPGALLGNAQTAAPQTTTEAPVQLVYPPIPAGALCH